MGNVTSNLIENALHASSSSAVVSTAAASITSSETLLSAGSDSKLFDQLRQQLAGDPTKLELYRLLQHEMERQSTTDDASLTPKAENLLRLKLVETMMKAEKKASPSVKMDTDDSSSTSSKGQSTGSQKTMLCPKKKYLKEYFDDDDPIWPPGR